MDWFGSRRHGRPIYKAPAPVYYPPVYNWTGLYMGVNGGYGWGTTNWSALGSSFDVSGGLFGGQVGYNRQFGQFVYGVEGDVDWTDIKGNSFVNGAAQRRTSAPPRTTSFHHTRPGRLCHRPLMLTHRRSRGRKHRNHHPFTTGVNQTKAG
jgi:hypothetical protein